MLPRTVASKVTCAPAPRARPRSDPAPRHDGLICAVQVRVMAWPTGAPLHAQESRTATVREWGTEFSERRRRGTRRRRRWACRSMETRARSSRFAGAIHAESDRTCLSLTCLRGRCRGAVGSSDSPSRVTPGRRGVSLVARRGRLRRPQTVGPAALFTLPTCIRTGSSRKLCSSTLLRVRRTGRPAPNVAAERRAPCIARRRSPDTVTKFG